MKSLFQVSSSPHIHSKQNIEKIMWQVIFSLVPVIVGSIYFFGIRVLFLIGVTGTVAILTEWICARIFHIPSRIYDGSAVITGLLLALSLPPTFPLWAAAIGGIVSILMGKMIFGGLGYNVFNPALVGRAFLQAAFPVHITTWSLPVKSLMSMPAVMTGATPLSAMKFQHIPAQNIDLFTGHIAGSTGETSALLIMAGGLYLMVKNIADRHIIFSVLISTIMAASILWLVSPEKFGSPVFQLLSGGFMLGTFYMATDMVTSPLSVKGKIIFGTGIGLLIILIRVFSGLPEGVMYSILLMNALVPWIDKMSVPSVFGSKPSGGL